MSFFWAAADHGPALANVVRQRLLTVDVQILLHGRQEGQRVPVRRRGDDHRVEAAGCEQVLVVLERPGPRALQLLDLGGAVGQMLAVHVTQGHHLHIAHFERGPDVDHAVAAAPDQAELELGLLRRPTTRGRRPFSARVPPAAVPMKSRRFICPMMSHPFLRPVSSRASGHGSVSSGSGCRSRRR